MYYTNSISVVIMKHLSADDLRINLWHLEAQTEASVPFGRVCRRPSLGPVLGRRPHLALPIAQSLPSGCGSPRGGLTRPFFVIHSVFP